VDFVHITEKLGTMTDLRRVLAYTKKYKKRLTFSILAATAYGLFAAAPMALLKHTIDDVFVNRYQHLIIPCIVGFIVLFACKGLFSFLSTYYMHWVGNRVVNDIRIDLFDKIIYFPLSFFKKKTTGELMSHFLNDIAMIQNASSNAVKHGVRSVFEGASLIGFAFYQNWKLACIAFVIAPFLIVTIQRMGRMVKRASRAIQGDVGSLSSVLQEVFVGVREVKVFNGEEIERNRFDRHLVRYFRSIMRNVSITSLAPAFIETIAMIGGGFVFYIAAGQVLSGVITPGQLISFVAALIASHQPIKRISNAYNDIQYGVAAASRIFKVMDMDYPAHHERPVVIPSFQKTIEFKNLSFGYEADNPVLDNASLVINKGDRIGLLGPSGSGKSTVCDLLLGFLEPTKGSIVIDGHDMKYISPSSLRSLIGSVSQQTFLFNDTIAANVAYACDGATNEKIVEACKRAHAHEFITQCKNGYKTFVGENGTLLSGGQKQRLTIARALLRNPDILIFDEATSALDQRSEEMIRLAIEEIGQTKTVIIVSHRVSLIKKMDRIFAIQDRQLVEVTEQIRGKEERRGAKESFVL